MGLAVLPEFQGKGVGKELMCHLELNAKNNSIAFIRLNSADYRVEAHKFYGCSTNPVGEKSPTGFFICKKEKSRL